MADECGCETRGTRRFLCSYHEGHKDGHADGARQERAAVVAYLRECAAETMIGGLVAATFATAADLIERGDHIPPDAKEGGGNG